MSTRTVDPKSIITPDSFTVAPDLLGIPLASPMRRAVAIACDMVPLAILIGAHAAVLAVAAAALLWRASTPTTRTGPVRQGVRGLLRVGAAVLAFFIVLRIGGAVFDDDNDERDYGGNGATDANVNVPDDIPLEVADLRRIPDMVGLVQADDAEEAARYARGMGDWLAGKDLAPERRRAVAASLLDDIDNPALRPAAESAFAAVLGELPRAPAGDSAVIAYAAALERDDSVAAAGLRTPAADAISAERVRSLQEQVEELTEMRDDLRGELGENEGGGVVAFIRSIGDDLGIGFGWGAVYFTGFLALWNGYTPGKRLLGIRVIRLDGKPLGWWRAFERFGGYAASLSTGLLGFLQILWDRNRQGLHDKAVETVVIRVGAPRVAVASVTTTPAAAPPLEPR